MTFFLCREEGGGGQTAMSHQNICKRYQDRSEIGSGLRSERYSMERLEAVSTKLGELAELWGNQDMGMFA